MSGKITQMQQNHQALRQNQPAKPVQQDPIESSQTLEPAALQRVLSDRVPARPTDILALQRIVGNRAVAGLIQAKLTVGSPGDQYEQEADHVADQVVQMGAQPEPVAQRQEEEEELQMKRLIQLQEEEEELQMKPLLQLQEDEEELQMKPLVQLQEDEEELQMKPLVQLQEEEEELQMKPLVQLQEEEEELQMKPLVQLQEDEEELQMKPLIQLQEDEEELQMKPFVQRQGDGRFEASPHLESRLTTLKGGGSPLPDEVRASMEPRFGVDFGRVRVHTGGEAAQMNRELQAQAFTHGQDIYFSPGRYSPGTQAGDRLLAHELTHTIQQSGGVNRISRWGGPGNTTSHDQVTEKAFETLDPKIRIWYSDEAKAYLANMSEQMDMRAGFLVLCGKGKLQQWWKKVWGEGMYKGEPTAKKQKKMSQGQYNEALLRAGKEYDDMVGYWRSASEAPNHAEAGMYKEDGKDINLARIQQYMENALAAWSTKNPRQALSLLALALHTAEDRGAHGDGKPGTGHDPRRLIPPPSTAKMGWVFYQSNPGWKPGQPPSWQGTDCDLKDKNPAGYHLGVMEAKRLLTEFAVGLGLGGEQITEEMMKKGSGLASFKQPGKFKRGVRKFGQFFGKGAIRP